MRPLLAAEGVGVRRGAAAILRDVSLSLEEGEVLGLVGPNGAGKSTLLRVLAGIERPTAGILRFDGEEVWGARGGAARLRGQVGVVLQEPLLLSLSVEENVALGLRFRGLPRGERCARARRWLDRLGIEGLAGRHAPSLSGGEAARVALARALACEPRLLFLDEPFASLDAPARREFVREVAGLAREQGWTGLFVSHDFREVSSLCRRVAVLEGGRLVQWGASEEVWERPATVATARLVGIENLWPAGWVGGGDGGRVFLGVRAGDLQAIPGGLGAAPAVPIAPGAEALTPAGSRDGVVALPCRLRCREFEGERVILRLEEGPRLWSVARPRGAGDGVEWREGEEGWLLLPPAQRLHWLAE